MSSTTDAMTVLQRRNKIILMGDSITQLSFSAKLSGWGAHLADVYQRRCDVYNRGMSGYNTDWYLEYLQSNVGKYDVLDSMLLNTTTTMTSSNNDPNNRQHEQELDSNVKLVTIFFGANDASCPILNPRHHVPLDRFQSNLKKIAGICRERFGQDVRIIFITPPPVHHATRLRYQIERYGEKASGELERNLDLASRYADAVEKVAKELGYPCLNIFQGMQDAAPEEEGWSKFLSDGLHLSSDGNMFLGEQLKALIDVKYPEISVTPCPHTGYTGNSASQGGASLGMDGKGVGPWHDEIDHLNSRVAFF